MAQVTGLDPQLSALRASFNGELIAADDDSYDEARSLWNGTIDKRPTVIARAGGVEDVIAAIRFARDNELEIAVRGGGHSFSGASSTEGGLVIDLSRMRSTTVDPAAKRVRVQGGATWGDLDAATQEHSLAVTGGMVSHTGIAGLTLGGGIGWLMRSCGATCDNLVGAEVVTADGRRLRADAGQNPDLFWALRGGGGNFGVVTEFEYRLHDVGPMVHGGLLFYAPERGVEFLRAYREWSDALPDEIGTLVAYLNAPPAPFVPENLQFTPGYGLIVAGTGAPERAEAAIAEMRKLGPLFEMVAPMPYTMLQRLIDDGNPWGSLAYEKGLDLGGLSDAAIDTMAEHCARKRSPLSVMPCFQRGGAISRVPEDATPFGGRSASHTLNIVGMAMSPDGIEEERVWVRAFWEAMQPYSNGSVYTNFLVEQDPALLRNEAFGPVKYDRLAGIKATYDPDNVFHLNQNIKPA